MQNLKINTLYRLEAFSCKQNNQ